MSASGYLLEVPDGYTPSGGCPVIGAIASMVSGNYACYCVAVGGVNYLALAGRRGQQIEISPESLAYLRGMISGLDDAGYFSSDSGANSQ